jgi:hypothetical protein
MKNEVLEMFRVLNEARKEDPKEFYSSIAFMVLLFGGFYAAVWIDAIINGRV